MNDITKYIIKDIETTDDVTALGTIMDIANMNGGTTLDITAENLKGFYTLEEKSVGAKYWNEQLKTVDWDEAARRAQQLYVGV